MRSVGDIIGNEILVPAVRAYPDLLRVHHFISRPSKTVHGQAPPVGEITMGRLDPVALEDLVVPLWHEREGGLRKMVVCGPDVLESMVFDAAIEGCGVDPDDVFVLPPNSYYSDDRSQMIL